MVKKFCSNYSFILQSTSWNQPVYFLEPTSLLPGTNQSTSWNQPVYYLEPTSLLPGTNQSTSWNQPVYYLEPTSLLQTAFKQPNSDINMYILLTTSLLPGTNQHRYHIKKHGYDPHRAQTHNLWNQMQIPPHWSDSSKRVCLYETIVQSKSIKQQTNQLKQPSVLHINKYITKQIICLQLKDIITKNFIQEIVSKNNK